VHALLGGVVEHRGIDHTDLPDDTKLLQRLYSLNVMRLEGHQPDVQLWTVSAVCGLTSLAGLCNSGKLPDLCLTSKLFVNWAVWKALELGPCSVVIMLTHGSCCTLLQEPGTVMHTVLLTTAPVAALQHLPGGGRLYVTPTLTQQLRGQLIQALELLYADSSDNGVQADAAAAQQAEAGRRRTRQQAAAASPAAAAAAAPKRARRGEGTGRTQQQPSQLSVTPPLGRQQQQQCWDKLNIIVTNQLGEEVHFRVFRGTRIASIMTAYCDKCDLDPHAMKFIFDGDCLQLENTIDDYNIEEGDTIDAWILQTGC
jgi:small ubiquitin-related modifier